MVDYFGSPTPLNQLAGISVSGTQSLVVSPYDKSAFKVIETAIMESGLGLMPNNEGRYGSEAVRRSCVVIECRYVFLGRIWSALRPSHLPLPCTVRNTACCG
jgi:hypothetical protein